MCTFAGRLLRDLCFLLLCAASLGLAQSPPGVPSQYRALYNQLSDELSDAERFLQGKVPPRNSRPMMFTELIAANAGSGPDLLTEGAKDNVILEMERYRELGLKGFQVSMSWPIVQSPFPDYQKYQAFYKWVADQARQRNMKLLVKFETFYHGTFYSEVNWSYKGLTLQQFTNGLMHQAQWVLENMKPEYLSILNEPDTNGANTGLDLNPDNYLKLIQGVLAGISRGRTCVGAGAGTWSTIDYFKKLARDTSLDAIDMHVYPIIDNILTTTIPQIHDLCRQNRKRLYVGECELEKVDEKTWNDRKKTQPTFMALKAYSFWEPLDERFLDVMDEEAKLYDIEFFDFFSGWYLWGNVAYGPTTSMPPLKPSEVFGLGQKAGEEGQKEDAPDELGQDVKEMLGR